MEKTVKLSQIIEVWKSHSGWYWFVTELHPDRLAFGLVRGHETEWGYFSLDELQDLRKRGMAWQVPKSHWAICPCVMDDTEHSSQGHSSADQTAARPTGIRVEAGEWIDIDVLVELLRKQGLDAGYENIRSWPSGFLARVTVDGREVGLVEGSGFGHLVISWDETVPSETEMKGGAMRT